MEIGELSCYSLFDEGIVTKTNVSAITDKGKRPVEFLSEYYWYKPYY
jgi:hypothetical protein